MRGIFEDPFDRLPDTRNNTAGGAGRSPGIGAGHNHRVPAPGRGARVYRVRKLCAGGEFATEFATIAQALAQWSVDKEGPGRPRVALIEICDNATYDEAPHIVMAPDERLELRAAHLAQPVLRLSYDDNGGPGKLRITGAGASALTIDGLVVSGGAIEIEQPSLEPALVPSLGQAGRVCVALRHCTLVPGWDAQLCSPAPWRGKASIVVRASDVDLQFDFSITGPIRVARRGGLLALQVNDSIVDAGHEAGLALADDAYGSAQARIGIARSTVIGVV